jgi:hypothetical protein
MKQQIRLGVFETNSSSIHSITITEKEIYDKWMKNEVLFCEDKNEFLEVDKAIEENLKILINDYDLESEYDDEKLEELKSKYRETKSIEETFDEEDIEYYCMYVTYQEWLDHNVYYYETYEKNYMTKKGDNIVAFGYYGHD